MSTTEPSADMTKRVLIGYGTRYGTTEEVVSEMARTIQQSGAVVDTVNLKKAKPPAPIHDYDLVVIGSGIAAGKWTGEPLKFLDGNLSQLAGKQVALFVVCGSAGSPEACVEAQAEYLDAIAAKYPSLSIASTGLFGGVFDFSKYSFPVRAIVRSILKKQLKTDDVPQRIDYRDWDKIRQWSAQLLGSSST